MLASHKITSFSLRLLQTKSRLSLMLTQINTCPRLTQRRVCSSVTLWCVKASECVGGVVEHGSVCGRGEERERAGRPTQYRQNMLTAEQCKPHQMPPRTEAGAQIWI